MKKFYTQFTFEYSFCFFNYTKAVKLSTNSTET